MTEKAADAVEETVEAITESISNASPWVKWVYIAGISLFAVAFIALAVHHTRKRFRNQTIATAVQMGEATAQQEIFNFIQSTEEAAADGDLTPTVRAGLMPGSLAVDPNPDGSPVT